jgi:hypothetical protein
VDSRRSQPVSGAEQYRRTEVAATFLSTCSDFFTAMTGGPLVRGYTYPCGDESHPTSPGIRRGADCSPAASAWSLPCTSLVPQAARSSTTQVASSAVLALETAVLTVVAVARPASSDCREGDDQDASDAIFIKRMPTRGVRPHHGEDSDLAPQEQSAGLGEARVENRLDDRGGRYEVQPADHDRPRQCVQRELPGLRRGRQHRRAPGWQVRHLPGHGRTVLGQDVQTGVPRRPDLQQQLDPLLDPAGRRLGARDPCAVLGSSCGHLRQDGCSPFRARSSGCRDCVVARYLSCYRQRGQRFPRTLRIAELRWPGWVPWYSSGASRAARR